MNGDDVRMKILMAAALALAALIATAAALAHSLSSGAWRPARGAETPPGISSELNSPFFATRAKVGH